MVYSYGTGFAAAVPIKWHFGRISSLRSSAPSGTLVNMEPARFPSSMPQTELAKKCCILLPKSTSFNAATERTAHHSICASIRLDLRSLYRGFPRSLSCYFHFALLYPYSSESHILASVQRHRVYFSCVFLFFLKSFLGRLIILSEIIQ